MTVNITEAKATFSELVARASSGERVVIVKNNLPLADLVPHTIEKPRELGLAKGLFTVPEGFDESDPETAGIFY